MDPYEKKMIKNVTFKKEPKDNHKKLIHKKLTMAAK